jgi:hypothetical protein
LAEAKRVLQVVALLRRLERRGVAQLIGGARRQFRARGLKSTAKRPLQNENVSKVFERMASTMPA